MNGVYDFVINKKLYYFSRIIKVSENDFQIEKIHSINNQLIYDTLLVRLNVDKISIRPSSLHNGIVGMNKFMKSNKYNFRIVKQSKYCKIPDTKICDDKKCIKFKIGHQYLTQFGWKPIYVENGKLFLLDNNRNRQVINNTLK